MSRDRKKTRRKKKKAPAVDLNPAGCWKEFIRTAQRQHVALHEHARLRQAHAFRSTTPQSAISASAECVQAGAPIIQ